MSTQLDIITPIQLKSFDGPKGRFYTTPEGNTKNDIIDTKLKERKCLFYRIGNYINNKTKIEWCCNVCNNNWMATPDKVINSLTGCPICAKNAPITLKTVDLLLTTLYITRMSDVKNISDKFKLICNTCKYEWSSNYRSLSKTNIGCPSCSKHEPTTNKKVDDFIRGKDFIRLENVKTSIYPILWKCNKCNNNWKAAPNRIMSHQTECPNCCNSRYSRVAINWLEHLMNQYNIHIQHAKNGGEFAIPTTKFRADGYCKETNTIYEFYGDKFHGNPQIYGPNEYCHPFLLDITANELYTKTMERENTIINLGYNIIRIWEQEWNNV
jgi:hypothetical protein